MSFWKSCLLAVGIILVAFVALLLGVIKIFPKYAEGEAIAVVKANYPTYAGSLSTADYLGQGRWQVAAGIHEQEDGSPIEVRFMVYEQTNTIEIIETPVLVGVTGPPVPEGRPITPYFLVLAGNVLIFAAHILFATIFWRRHRRLKVTQTQNS